MPKTNPADSTFADYAPVADRITLFYQKYPRGRIVTRLHSRTEREVTFRALVYRGSDDAMPAATGWASEREGDGDVNTVACLENTETSAIGRALANLGFTASTKRPSREEMQKVSRERARGISTPGVVAESRSSAEPPSVDDDPVQRRANAVHDVLDLLRRAEALGFPERRIAALRKILLGDPPPPDRLAGLERRLRAWSARHRSPGRWAVTPRCFYQGERSTGGRALPPG
jgi:hypothetical protein